MKRLFVILILFSTLNGCVKNPTTIKENDIIDFSSHFSIVLCEGLFGYNNASLTFCNLDRGMSDINFFENINNFPLGDIANDAIKIGDYLYVVLSNSKTIYKINFNNGRVENKLNLNGENFPRKLCIISDSIGIYTDAYSNTLNEINLNSMNVTKSLTIGPQPEGLAYFNGKIYVANSGWGDVNKNAPGASTISIVDVSSFEEVNRVPTGLDPTEIQIDTNKKLLYVLYYNLPSLKDSLGGIIQYDLISGQKKDEWRGNFSNMQLSLSCDSILVVKGGFQKKTELYQNSIFLIDLKNKSTKDLIGNNNENENWFNFQIDYLRNQIWISNAKNFQSNGEILIYDLFSKILIKKYSTGINPSKIIFKKS